MGEAGASRVFGALSVAFAILIAAAAIPFGRGATAAPEPVAARNVHEGVASCAGSTCHSRQVDSGLNVRQNELITWQDPSSQAGAHSRAWRVLTEPRAQAIARKMGIGPAQNAKECLGCHADPVATSQRGARFQISDGVGCESRLRARPVFQSSATLDGRR